MDRDTLIAEMSKRWRPTMEPSALIAACADVALTWLDTDTTTAHEEDSAELAAELRAERDALNAEIRRCTARLDEIARLLPAAIGEEKRAGWESWLNEDRATRPTRTDEWEEIEPPRYVERWGKWLRGRRVIVRCESRTPAGGMRLVTETRWQDEPRTLDRRTVAARTNELELWRSRFASVR